MSRKTIEFQDFYAFDFLDDELQVIRAERVVSFLVSVWENQMKDIGAVVLEKPGNILRIRVGVNLEPGER